MESKQQQAKEAFDLFAKGGYLPLQYCPIVLRALDLNPSKADVKSFIERLKSKPDAEKRGVDFATFQSEATAFMVRGFDKKEAVLAAFRVFDRDGTGELPLSDLQHILTSTGEKLDATEWQALTATLGDVVRYEDFADVLLKPYTSLGNPQDLE
eukprot:TRINITY_DN70136_c0_g1_i1.p3 TRINITY_DN70136_c0_g1~~TRINITY_DN70136_c0_g1_i1.p3  ORF type:complete len:154 (-),score=32.29 TRINITY_DN70136_c0_g1_i1:509-970(-)